MRLFETIQLFVNYLYNKEFMIYNHAKKKKTSRNNYTKKCKYKYAINTIL